MFWSRTRGLYGSLVIAVVAVIVASVAWFVVTRADAEAPVCRLLSNPAQVSPLTEGTLKDLDSGESRLDPGDLTTPSQPDAEVVAALLPSSHGVHWACGYRNSGEVAVISRSKELANRCLGIACGDETKVWVTCYRAVDVTTKATTLHGRCLGFPHNITDS